MKRNVLKKWHWQRPVILPDKLDPHTFSVLISDHLAELHPSNARPLPCSPGGGGAGWWARARLTRGRAGEQLPQDPFVLGRRKKVKVKSLPAESAGTRQGGGDSVPDRSINRTLHKPFKNQATVCFYLVGALLSALISEISYLFQTELACGGPSGGSPVGWVNQFRFAWSVVSTLRRLN